MALIFWDGFDNYPDAASLTASRPISYGSLFIQYNATAGRFGGVSFCTYGAGALPENDSICYSNVNMGNDIWSGRGLFFTTASGEYWIAGCGSFPVTGTNTLGTSNVDIVVVTTGDGTLYLYKGRGPRYTGSTLLANTVPGVLQNGRFNWVETRFNLHPTTGVVEVWVNNQQVLSYSGNTKNSAATTANQIGVIFQAGSTAALPSSAAVCHFDDFYVLDTTGAAPWNTRLGDVRIANIVPVADVPGANTGTQTTGTTHFGVVDELPPNTTDYVMLPGAAGNLERFRASNLSIVPANVYALQAYSRIQKSDAGTANIVFNIIANGSNFVANSNTDSISTSWTVISEGFTTNPQTGQAWTAANIAGLQIGVTTVA